ncbi:PASTA domain-containing protein [Sphingobacterium corticis]|uniref:PASTA domain-containing protein n=1 Tax=Sphingobacterium corticis TaxID=1812823 RepID=A0ABW5NPY4_9SPHI
MSKFFLYLRTNTFRKNLIYAIVGIIALFVLVYFGLRVYTKHGDRQEVPVLKGLHIGEAIDILKKAGLEYQVDSVYQMDARPGLVIDQDPEPASAVKGGRTIYLTMITQTAPEIAFPEVVDKTLIEVISIIKNHSLVLGDTTYINDIARDVVLDARFGGQPITAGRMIPKGSRINLVLGNGRGNDQVNIPELVGLPYSEAEFALRGLGLVIGNISFADGSRDTLNATVVEQTPDISSQFISLGSAIHLKLSNSVVPTAPSTINE